MPPDPPSFQSFSFQQIPMADPSQRPLCEAVSERPLCAAVSERPLCAAVSERPLCAEGLSKGLSECSLLLQRPLCAAVSVGLS